MKTLFYSWPQQWPKGVGFHKPAVRQPSRPHCTTSPRASSPRLVQGGSIEVLMQGIWPQPSHSPDNRTSIVVGPAPPDGSAHPTTPTSTLVDRSRPLGPTRVPSVLRPSVDAGVSHVPAAPARPSLGGGGRLTPTTGAARNSPLYPLPSRPYGGRQRRHLSRQARYPQPQRKK